MSSSRFSSSSNSRTLPPRWKSKPILSSQGLNWQDVQFDYYKHHPYVLPQHCYSKHLLKVFLSEGRMERCLGDKKRNEHVSPGDVAVIPADLNHHASWRDNIEFILLSIRPDLLTNLARTTVNNSAVKIIPQFATQDPLIYSIAMAIKTQLESDRYSCSSYAQVLFQAVSIHLLKKYSESQSQTSNHDNTSVKQRLQIALDYIEKNLDEKLTLELLAERVNISKFYLCRLFSKHLNITPRQYIIEQRIYKAKHLLEQKPSMQIVDIALNCGFASHSHFNRQFNRNTGMSPKTYRNSCN